MEDNAQETNRHRDHLPNGNALFDSYEVGSDKRTLNNGVFGVGYTTANENTEIKMSSNQTVPGEELPIGGSGHDWERSIGDKAFENSNGSFTKCSDNLDKNDYIRKTDKDLCYCDVPLEKSDFDETVPHDEDALNKLLARRTSASISEKTDKGPPRWRSQRYILAYFMFGGMMNVFYHRVNLSIAIICMVNHTAVHLQTHPFYADSHSGNEIITLSQSTSSSNMTGSLPSGINQLGSEIKDSNGLKDNLNSNGSFPHDLKNVKYNVSKSIRRSERALEDGISYKNTDVYSGNKSLNPVTHNNESEPDACAAGYMTEEEQKEDGPLVWTKHTQGLLLGALYWGYVIVQIPGNHLVRNWKRRSVIILAMFTMATASVLCHVCALWSPWALFAMRTIQGCATAFLVIAIYGVWQKWAPPGEKAGLISVAWSGQMFGNMSGFPLSALLCEYGFMDGWQSIFYVCGIISFVWVILFALLTSETPEENRFITEKERNYIVSSLPASTHEKKLPPTPWTSILVSGPFWGIVFSHISFTYGMILQLSTMPQYMYEVLKLDIKSNGLLSMLPYTCLLICTQVSGQMSDMLIRRQVLRPAWTRKLCVIIGNTTPAVLLVALSFVDCTQPGLAISFLTVAVGVAGFSLTGFLVNPTDIAPRFASQLLTVSNTLAAIPGIIVPYVVAAITVDQSREQWQRVFFKTSAIYLLGMLGFCILGQADVQPWAAEKEAEFVVGLDSPRTDMKKTASEKV